MPQCSERGTGALPERPRPPSCHHPSICHPRSLAICHLSPSCECVLLPRRLSCTQTAALPMSPKARQAPCSADVRSVVLANIAVPFIRLINAALDTPARLWSLVFRQYYSARTSADASSPSFFDSSHSFSILTHLSPRKPYDQHSARNTTLLPFCVSSQLSSLIFNPLSCPLVPWPTRLSQQPEFHDFRLVSRSASLTSTSNILSHPSWSVALLNSLGRRLRPSRLLHSGEKQ